MVGVVLNSDTVRLECTSLSHVQVYTAIPFGESPFLGSVDLLSSRELEFRSPESFNSNSLMLVFASDGNQSLTNVNTGNRSLRFAKSTSHSCLEPISSCTRQHFVDSVDVVRVSSDTDVESIFSSYFYHVLVGTDSGSLKCFTGKLLLLVGHKIHTLRKIINGSPLLTKIKDPNLRIWYTTQVS